MKISRIAISRVVINMLELTDAKSIIYYLDAETVVKCTRIHKHNKRHRSESFVLTFGKPNYAERKFIKLCQQAEQSFPVNKLQIRWIK